MRQVWIGALVAFVLGAAGCGSTKTIPGEVSNLIASATSEEARQLLTRCAEEWWPVLSGTEKVRLHVIMNTDFVYADAHRAFPEAVKHRGVSPNPEYRIENRFEIWQQPPDQMRTDGPFGGTNMSIWRVHGRLTTFIPEAGIHKTVPDPEASLPFGLSSRLSVAVRKLVTASKLGTVVITEQPREGTLAVFDIGVLHSEAVIEASPVPMLTRLWIDEASARPTRTLFRGGLADLDVRWGTLEKDQPIPAEVFESPANMGREASDEELVQAIFGKVFPEPPLPGETPAPDSAAESLRYAMAFNGEVLYQEQASEVDLMTVIGQQGLPAGHEAKIGYSHSGISIEVRKEEAWKNVRVTINADLGPEAYSAYVQEVTPQTLVTIPFSDFRNPQGVEYTPRNFRFGRTTIEANGETKRGVAWESCF